ncbi:conjugal transfer protein TraO [Vibrio alginolyticus]|uniref:IncP plasmid survival protein KfrB n=1 Tax=Vibrio TaxID=662 RepID=UPI001CDC1631|nr:MULTISPECIES: IncP plasmid survival protein KfrB [Vibrio]MCA2452720.1 conjugal transfer protein TraO [Vibrio alginolyticus]MCG6307736.1 conjugal transfer protein TraO [Vibrio alginolyticus]MDW1906890.1 IncP plasmid survival protein KfrB [Vibrio sp. 705]MDW2232722.1 IncP plasmid survival protein KfrB [Vibrio sp. 2091]
MKQRLLVMNGQRIIQTDNSGAWTNQKVEKAGALKPGIYNLYMAKEADKSKSHDGMIVHADTNKVYQQIGKNFVMHSKENFDIVPEIGSVKSINYDASGKAVVTQAVKLSRGRSR